jgi:hypothetical protein
MQMLQNTKVRIKNEQSRETDNDTQDEKKPITQVIQSRQVR